MTGTQRLLLRKAAFEYLYNGWSVIPLVGKRPLINWKRYQTEMPEQELIEQWFRDDRVTGVGIVTGKISNLAVLDIDKGSNFPTKNLPETLSAITGNNGFHYYFQYPLGKELRNKVGLYLKTDIRAEAGYVVAPPSIHPETGKTYEWLVDSVPPSPFPEFLAEASSSDQKHQPLDKHNIFSGVQEGRRNTAATSVTGKLLSTFHQNDWETSAWELLKAWNLRNIPPLEESELRTVFVSIYNREFEKRANGTQFLTSFSLTDLLSKEFSESEWLINQLVPKNGITCLAGKPGVGKSFLTLYLAKVLTTKTLLFGKFNSFPSNVCILTKEDPQQLIQKRIKLLDFNENLPVVFSDDMTALCNNEQQLQRLRELIQRTKSDVLIIDSFIRVVGGDENLSKDVTKVHEVFKKLTQEGVTVIFTHHQGKEDARQSGIDKPRGSSDIGAMVDSLINVTKKDDILLIEQAKSRCDVPCKPFFVHFPNFLNTFDFEFLSFKKDEGGLIEITPIDEAMSDILSLLERMKEPIHQAEIIKQLNSPNYSDSTVKNALSRLEEIRKVDSKKIGGKKYYQSISSYEDIENVQMSEVVTQPVTQAEAV